MLFHSSFTHILITSNFFESSGRFQFMASFILDGTNSKDFKIAGVLLILVVFNYLVITNLEQRSEFIKITTCRL